jgi:hypothetical protein
MKVLLKAGELKWSYEGTHVWDDKGVALSCESDEEVEIDDSKVDEVLGFVRASREFRGMDPETGMPLPEPVVVEEPANAEEVTNG